MTRRASPAPGAEPDATSSYERRRVRASSGASDAHGTVPGAGREMQVEPHRLDPAGARRVRAARRSCRGRRTGSRARAAARSARRVAARHGQPRCGRGRHRGTCRPPRSRAGERARRRPAGSWDAHSRSRIVRREVLDRDPDPVSAARPAAGAARTRERAGSAPIAERARAWSTSSSAPASSA